MTYLFYINILCNFISYLKPRFIIWNTIFNLFIINCGCRYNKFFSCYVEIFVLILKYLGTAELQIKNSGNGNWARASEWLTQKSCEPLWKCVIILRVTLNKLYIPILDINLNPYYIKQFWNENLKHNGILMIIICIITHEYDT